MSSIKLTEIRIWNPAIVCFYIYIYKCFTRNFLKMHRILYFHLKNDEWTPVSLEIVCKESFRKWKCYALLCNVYFQKLYKCYQCMVKTRGVHFESYWSFSCGCFWKHVKGVAFGSRRLLFRKIKKKLIFSTSKHYDVFNNLNQLTVFHHCLIGLKFLYIVTSYLLN